LKRSREGSLATIAGARGNWGLDCQRTGGSGGFSV
jgi:hypothetical protein